MNLELGNETQGNDIITGGTQIEETTSLETAATATAENAATEETHAANNNGEPTVTQEAAEAKYEATVEIALPTGEATPSLTETVNAETEQIAQANATADVESESAAEPTVRERRGNNSEARARELMQWWEQQSFPGKALYRLEETGSLYLMPLHFMKERVVATISPENCDFVLKNLRDKFNDVVARVTEMEAEWIAAEDKLRVADKVENLRDFLQHTNAIGDFEKLAEILVQWGKTINELIAENIQLKTKLAEIAEGYLESKLWKEGPQAFKDISEKWKQVGYIDKSTNDKLWNRIEAAKTGFFDRKRAFHENEEKDMLDALDLKIELAEQAEALAASEEWKKTSEKFQAIMDKWKSLGRTLPKKNEELWQRIIAAKTAFYDRKKVHFQNIHKEQEANLVIKEVLVTKAEAMRESTDWTATAQAYTALMDEWKKTGRVPHEKADEMWKRFIEAQEQFFEAKRKHTEGRRLELENNYNMKLSLLKKAEELKNSSRWGEVTGEMNKLLDEWKTIGPVPREHTKKMWEQFLGARKHFFNRKDASRAQKQVYMETMKSARMQQAHELVFKMQEEIAQEEERLADLENALQNVTPGKKADELKAHLAVLIGDSRAKTKRLLEKMDAGNEEIKFLEEKERKEKERKEKETEAEA